MILWKMVPQTSGTGGRRKGTEGRAGNRKGESRWRERTDDYAHEDGRKAQMSWALSQGACASDVRQHYADRQEEMRTHVQWK